MHPTGLQIGGAGINQRTAACAGIMNAKPGKRIAIASVCFIVFGSG